jgi:hypothetical protein
MFAAPLEYAARMNKREGHDFAHVAAKFPQVLTAHCDAESIGAPHSI